MLEFNHAMIYTADFERSLGFYKDLLGFELLEEHAGGYARLKSPGGRTTIALHVLEKPQQLDGTREGMRLYFEVESLDAFCEVLLAEGAKLEQMPRDMPWGWRHAYLRDPDGRQLSLYWAGEKRFEKSS